MAVEDNLDSSMVPGSHEVGFLESWISEMSRAKEPLNYAFGSSSTSSSARMLQMMNNAHLVYNDSSSAALAKPSDSWLSFIGSNYAPKDANLLLQNNALLQMQSVRDIDTVSPFALNNFDGQRLKRQQMQSIMMNNSAAATEQGLGLDMYQISCPRGYRIEGITQLSKKPRSDITFEKSLQQLHEKNTELKAMIQQHRMQNQQWHELQNQAQVSSMPCFDGYICTRRLMQYLYHTRSRPSNNDMSYWRKFTSEYYAPCAKRRWCLSVCEKIDQQSMGLFSEKDMGSWCCSICDSKPTKGFEVVFETLPRLLNTNFESGVLDEILFLGPPREHRFASGSIMLEFDKAVQESIHENFRVVHEGKLRVTFGRDLKILSWEFCAQRYEELLQHRLITRQIERFVEAAEKYKSTIDDFDGAEDIQSCCNMFLTAGNELAKNVELTSVNALGFSKKYFRCLQISEVVSTMKDLITISQDLGIGPIESLKNYRELKEATEQKMTQSVVDKVPFGMETTRKALSGLGTANGAMKTIGGTQISNSVRLANAIDFGSDNAVNIMANAQISGEMCKVAFNGSSSTAANMPVEVAGVIGSNLESIGW